MQNYATLVITRHITYLLFQSLYAQYHWKSNGSFKKRKLAWHGYQITGCTKDIKHFYQDIQQFN